MKGKIFKDSENVYQDQARILLDFYEKAAEKIVFEEKHIERRKTELEEELAALNKDISRTSLLKWLLFIFIIPFIINTQVVTFEQLGTQTCCSE
jgi:phosphate uptake regulator